MAMTRQRSTNTSSSSSGNSSELRSARPAQRAIAQEINRIGEQTAAILRVAHEKADEVTRDAQAQADKVLADAASNALAITEGASRQLRELDSRPTRSGRSGCSLIEDVRSVATALFTLAEDAAERYPGRAAPETRPPPTRSGRRRGAPLEPAVG